MLLGQLMALVCLVSGFRADKHHCTSNFILNANKIFLNRLNSSNNSINYDHLSQLHNEAFESPQFQIHIPPISDYLPSLNKELTNSSVYSTITGYSGESSTTDGSAGPRGSEDSTSASNKESSSDDYIDGPLDVLKMINSGLIPEYRPSSSFSKGSQSSNVNRNQLFSCRFERPADLFLVNFSTIDLGYREYIYTSCKVLQNLDLFKGDSKVQRLFESVFSNQIPVWLSTCFNCAFPNCDGITDYVLTVYYYIGRYRDSTTVDTGANGANSNVSTGGKYSKADNVVDSLDNLIKNGNPFELVDYLSDERYRLNLTGNELNNWKVNGLYNKLMNAFTGVDLKKLFMEERRELKENHKLYKELVMYRKKKHISFNNSIVQLINYYTKYLKMPLYIITDIEDVGEVYLRLKMFGVKSNELVKVFNLCSQTDSDNDHKGGQDGDVAQLLTHMKLNPLIPIHYFDNSINNLKYMLSNSKFENVRLYFVDWGRSTYNHKLEALYTDKIKYIKSTSKLVEFICKFNTFCSREWTHGYRLRYPNEEEQEFLLNWKDKWHKSIDKTVS